MSDVMNIPESFSNLNYVLASKIATPILSSLSPLVLCGGIGVTDDDKVFSVGPMFDGDASLNNNALDYLCGLIQKEIDNPPRGFNPNFMTKAQQFADSASFMQDLIVPPYVKAI
jgi:hypothetical protein